jgi:hypothetical protein
MWKEASVELTITCSCGLMPYIEPRTFKLHKGGFAATQQAFGSAISNHEALLLLYAAGGLSITRGASASCPQSAFSLSKQCGCKTTQAGRLRIQSVRVALKQRIEDRCGYVWQPRR